MADDGILLDRAERLALVLRCATIVRLSGDDLRLLAALVDTVEGLDAGRAAAWARFAPLLAEFLADGSRPEWSDNLDAGTHARLVDDAWTCLGLEIERRPPPETPEP